MPGYNHRRIIVISAAQRDAASAIATAVGAGSVSFTVGLVPSGGAKDAAPTHYWCDWRMQDGHRDSLNAGIAALVSLGHARVYDAEVNTPEQILRSLGLQVRRTGPER